MLGNTALAKPRNRATIIAIRDVFRFPRPCATRRATIHFPDKPKIAPRAHTDERTPRRGPLSLRGGKKGARRIPLNRQDNLNAQHALNSLTHSPDPQTPNDGKLQICARLLQPHPLKCAAYQKADWHHMRKTPTQYIINSLGRLEDIPVGYKQHLSLITQHFNATIEIPWGPVGIPGDPGGTR